MGRKFYITTPIYYVNNLPHLGTAYSTLCTDILARYGRLLGWDVYFLTGTDEHSFSVEKKAKELNIPPIEYCNRMAEEYKKIWKEIGITYDYFVRTTYPEHEEAVLEIFKRLLDKKLIYKATYKGLYCYSCENYIKESDLSDGKCPYHKSLPAKLEEENYFFRLSVFKEELKKSFLEKERFLLPRIRKNEMLSILEGELEDISISRTNFTFGIKVPGDPQHIIYVWIDALVNYLTACGFPKDTDKFKYWWPADIHIMAKDITRFHTIIWPAMLMGAGLELPTCAFAHGFLNFGGSKMSKTLGNIVSPQELVKKYGNDAVRFYCVKESSFGDDFDFSEENIVKRYNSELANEWGNLVQRLLTMSKNYCNFVVSKSNFSFTTDLLNNIQNLYENLENNILLCNIHQIVNNGWSIIKEMNRMLDEQAPWKLYKTDKEKAVKIVDTFIIISTYLNKYLSPILIDSSTKLQKSLASNMEHFKNLISFSEFLNNLPSTYTITPLPILFPKIQ